MQRLSIKDSGLSDDLLRHDAICVFLESLRDLAESAVMLFRPMAMSDKGVQSAQDRTGFALARDGKPDLGRSC